MDMNWIQQSMAVKASLINICVLKWHFVVLEKKSKIKMYIYNINEGIMQTQKYVSE